MLFFFYCRLSEGYPTTAGGAASSCSLGILSPNSAGRPAPNNG